MSRRLLFAPRVVAAVGATMQLLACAPTAVPVSAATDREEIYVLRSIREAHQPVAGWCDAARTGFEPLPKDAERFFSFWSIDVQAEDGRVVDAQVARVAELRGCFGATDEPARQRFYAEIQLGSIAVRGRGECVAAAVGVPEPGLFPVRCQLMLSAPAPWVGGLLTTNTIASQAPLGGASQPPGYTQASIATIRLWRGK